MDDDKTEIGYKNPPKNTQFKKGESGNPAGRPKGSRNVKTILNEVLAAEIPVTIGGKTKIISKKEAMIHKLANDALSKQNGHKQAFYLLNMSVNFEQYDEAKGTDYNFSHNDNDILSSVFGREKDDEFDE